MNDVGPTTLSPHHKPRWWAPVFLGFLAGFAVAFAFAPSWWQPPLAEVGFVTKSPSTFLAPAPAGLLSSDPLDFESVSETDDGSDQSDVVWKSHYRYPSLYPFLASDGTGPMPPPVTRTGPLRNLPATLDLWSWEAIPNEPRDSVFDPEFAQHIGYFGPDLKLCSSRKGSMVPFIRFARIMEENKLPWMLAHGVNLGYARTRDFTPWDRDIDVYVPSWVLPTLKQYTTPNIAAAAKGTVVFYVHPEGDTTTMNSRTRRNCKGEVVSKQVDRCAFVEPVARMWRIGDEGASMVDIFQADLIPGTRTIIHYLRNRLSAMDAEIYLPPRPCTFMDLPAYCPNDVKNAALHGYGPKLTRAAPPYVCDPETNTFREATKEELATEIVRRENQFGEAVMRQEAQGEIDIITDCKKAAKKYGKKLLEMPYCQTEKVAKVDGNDEDKAGKK